MVWKDPNHDKHKVGECGCEKEEARKTRQIAALPEVLCLRMKRLLRGHVKLTHKVLFEDTMTITVGGVASRYELYSTINHDGSGSGGHYVAHTKKAEQWYRASDTYVTRTELFDAR